MNEIMKSVWEALATLLLASGVGICHVLMISAVAKIPLTRRIVLVDSAICVVLTLLRTYVPTEIWGNIGVGCSFGGFLLSAWLAFEKKGWAWLLLSLEQLGACLVMELSLAGVLLLLDKAGMPISSIIQTNLAEQHSLLPILVTCSLTIVCQLLIAGVAWGLRRLFGKHEHVAKDNKRRLYAKIIVRLVALVALCAGMQVILAGFILRELQSSSEVMQGFYLPMTLLNLLLMCVAGSYFVQDMKYLSQLQRNDTLEHRQEAFQTLLGSLRHFRHNMVNMLYGFEDAILSGDAAEVKDYYREMTERCALVNNENIVALERINNQSVSSVLLRMLDKARQENLPVNLYIQEQVVIGKALPVSELCQVLGVLMDNAVEAAVQAETKYASVEMRNVDDALEILVKNTYAGTVTEAMLRAGSSSKAGHAGQGLQSVFELLKRRAAFINFQISSQYVQAQLLLPQK